MPLWRHLKKIFFPGFPEKNALIHKVFWTLITISYEQSSFCTPFLMVLDRGIKGVTRINSNQRN
jgi:hypothetical protein